MQQAKSIVVYHVHTGLLSFLPIRINKSHVIPHVTFSTLKFFSQKFTTYNSVAAQAILLKLCLSNRKCVTCSWVDEITPKHWVSVCSQSFGSFFQSERSYSMYYIWITCPDEQITEQNCMYMITTYSLSLLHICSVGVMAQVWSDRPFYDKSYSQSFFPAHLGNPNNVCSEESYPSSALINMRTPSSWCLSQTLKLIPQKVKCA